jgi:Magnesium transporter NIPA
LCIIGSTIIVLHSPKEVEIEDLDVLVSKLKDPTFIIYVFVILTMAGIIAFYVGPRSGHRNVYVVSRSLYQMQLAFLFRSICFSTFYYALVLVR